MRICFTIVFTLNCLLSTLFANHVTIKGSLIGLKNTHELVNVKLLILSAQSNTVKTFNTQSNQDGQYFFDVDLTGSPGSTTFIAKLALLNCNRQEIYRTMEVQNGKNYENIDLVYCDESNDLDSCTVTIERLVTIPGRIHLNAVATGNEPIQYFWSDGSTTQSVIVDRNTEYCVTIVTADGCRAKDCFTFENDDRDSCSVAIVRLEENGVIYLIAETRGQGPFRYFWSDGSTSQRIEAKPNQTYCVKVINARGCEAKACLDQDDDPKCKVSISVRPLDSLIVLTAMPLGQSPFQFLWSNGETTQQIVVSRPLQKYCVTITDADGCESEACTPNISPAKCGVVLRRVLSNTGDIFLVAIASGQEPFTYLWSNGSTSDRVLFEPNQRYCVTISDSRGCTASTCLENPNNARCRVNISRLPSEEGIVLLAIPVPIGNVRFEWSTGENSPRITVNEPGIYCVTATFSNGCQAKACFTVQDSMGDIPCIRGRIMVSYNPDSSEATLSFISVGPSNFQYLWNTGETTQSITVNHSGIYYLTVSDLENRNCSEVFKVEVNLNDCRVRIIARHLGDGMIQLNALLESISTRNPTFQWSTGDTTRFIIVPSEPAEYCVTVSTGNCKSSTCITIGRQGPRFTIRGSVNASENYGILQLQEIHLDGRIPDFVIWNTGELSMSIATAQSGMYSVIIVYHDGSFEELMYELKLRSYNQVQKNQPWHIFPNPVMSELNLSGFSNHQHLGSLSIIDLHGKVVHQQSLLFSEGNHTYTVDLSQLSPGAYVIQIVQESQVSTQKFVKK